MDWSSYAARRKLDVAQWCLHHRFKTYAQVKKWCAANDVEAPERSVVSPHLLKKPPKAKPPVQTKTKAPTTKKRGSKKTQTKGE